ncbi:MAG: anthranilate phosphoribosyltransferase [Candidatus Omnitrophica bacterium]|nr:anthranilate phosphoribosyltransferase [Candidatus Omnitrophota bacterium]
MMREFINKIQQKINLSQEEIESVMQEIMSGQAKNQDIADFLMALREKGPTIDEITGAARIMRRFVVPVTTKHQRIIDTCGTGGDKMNTFNISTISAFVVAGAGGIVAKHGNRSVSSNCGSACVLEKCGVNLNVEEKHLSACLDQVGIAFLFAQRLHPAMKNVAPVRKELGVETIFNVLGPLTNPASATHQVMGVYHRDFVEPMARVLKNLGLQRALVVHGSDGLDEITSTGSTFMCEYNGEDIQSYEFNPEELGVSLARGSDLIGGNVGENVRIFKKILSGAQGPKRDIVVLNAAFALYVGEIVPNIQAGFDAAKKSIDSGMAQKKLDDLIELTHSPVLD